MYLADLERLYLRRTGKGGGSKARARSASKDQARGRLIRFEIEIEVRYLRASGRRVATNGLHFWAHNLIFFRMVEFPFTVSLCTALSLRPANPGLGQTLLKPRGNFWRVRRQRAALIRIEHPLPCGFEMCFVIAIVLPPIRPCRKDTKAILLGASSRTLIASTHTRSC